MLLILYDVKNMLRIASYRMHLKYFIGSLTSERSTTI